MEDLYKKVLEQAEGDFYDRDPEKLYAVAVLITAVQNGSVLTDPENVLLTRLSNGEDMPNLEADILNGLLATRFNQEYWDIFQDTIRLQEQNKLSEELHGFYDQELRFRRTGSLMSQEERDVVMRQIQENKPRVEFLKQRINQLKQETS